MNKPTVNYDGPLHQSFHEVRTLDRSVMQQWRAKIRDCLGDRTGLTILDLGSGTGRFSAALAEEFDADVFGVEPSDKMRAVAERLSRHPRVQFCKGAADNIPLQPASCDLAWLSQILHHVPDITAAAAELQRVVRSSGRVLIRNNFKGRLKEHCRYYEFFPAGLAADEARFPTIEQSCAAFEIHGFRFISHAVIEQLETPSLKEYAERIRRRVYSTFELISDDEFAVGLAAMEAAAAAEDPPQPVVGKLDLLEFERT